MNLEGHHSREVCFSKGFREASARASERVLRGEGFPSDSMLVTLWELLELQMIWGFAGQGCLPDWTCRALSLPRQVF